jgi:ribosomal-protein-alanine N-acetyltransferase
MESIKKRDDSGFALQIRIDEVTIDDLTAVINLERECGLNSRGIESYQNLLSDSRAVLLVAKESAERQRVIGLFSGFVILNELEIDNLAVIEVYRRQGIGQLLLKSGLAIAGGMGADAAILEVRSANSPAREFYEKNGFNRVGFRKKYYSSPPDDALLLRCEIQKPVRNVS